jgi:hypothetical protein
MSIEFSFKSHLIKTTKPYQVRVRDDDYTLNMFVAVFKNGVMVQEKEFTRIVGSDITRLYKIVQSWVDSVVSNKSMFNHVKA